MILFRFEAHLINEHGALFDIEFLIKVSLYKSQHSSLPDLQIDPQPKVKRLYIYYIVILNAQKRQTTFWNWWNYGFF